MTPKTLRVLRGQPLSLRLAARVMVGIREGRLDIHLPDGTAVRFQGHEPGPHAVFLARSADFIRPALLWGEAGFTRSYLDGGFDTPDLTAALAIMLQWANGRAATAFRIGHLLRARLVRLAQALRHNSRRGARRNILAHYDLGNEFYASWLDPGMTYSSGLFSQGDELLEEAQEAKYRRITKTLELDSDDHVLEIGGGWGGFAEYAARRHGSRVTSITISDQQYAYARKRMQEGGLDERVDVRLCDYRNVSGKFDAIVSIEMFEAVGERYWPVFFERLKRALKPEGEVVMQAITISESYFDYYRRHGDFIRDYIFPGGFLPTRERLAALARSAGLVISDTFMFGDSYVRTLRNWHRTFDARWEDIKKLGFDDRFGRIWRTYLCYCEAGFDTKRVDVGQFRLRHA